MEYTILVSHNGRHLFETQPRSTPTREDAMDLYKILCKCFPVQEGYCVKIFKTMNVTECIWNSKEECTCKE